MSENEKKTLSDEERRRLITEKQKAKIEKVAKDENLNKSSTDEPKKVVVEEKKEEENFEEVYVEHTTIDEEQEKELLQAKEEYTGKDIEILQGLEAVRQRPGMYIGTTSSKGLHHLVREAVDNGIDEALAGYCKHIKVTILPADDLTPLNRVRVEDDGRGIPCDINAQSGLSTVETVYTILHAGGKFNAKTGYKISGGLHGIGVKAVNALSTYVKVTVYRDGKIHEIEFRNGGHTVKPLSVVGDCPVEKTGTTVEFCPDPTIFKETTTFDFSTINIYLRQTAYLTRGLDITLTDIRDKDNILESHYKFDRGIEEFVQYINDNKSPIFDKVVYTKGESVVNVGEGDNKSQITVIVECAMQPTSGSLLSLNSFCNNIRTTGGGTHEEGFRLAIGRVLNKYFRSKEFLKEKDENFKTDDCLEGLTAVLSIKHTNPQYEGQVKDKLGNDEVRSITSTIVGDYLMTFLLENPKEGKAWFDRVHMAYKGRKAAERAKEQASGKLSAGGGLPDKLTDCISKLPEERELFIVEGNSAGGSAVMGRDAKTQAILPLRGKILNIEKAPAYKIENNEEIYSLVTAIGGGQGEGFDISKIKYHKVIIMTDADVDGSHIRILLMTFFYRFMRPLIENGNLYIALPPLYRLTYQGKHYYAFNDEELEDIKAKLPANSRYALQRYKGLGEMDPDQLNETTMDKNHRKMLQVTIEDAEASNNVLIDLMGDSASSRKDFITANAKFVKNLDI